MAPASRSDSTAPNTLKVKKKMANITAMKMGMAVYLPVSTRSIFMLRWCSRLSRQRTTVFRQIRSIKS